MKICFIGYTGLKEYSGEKSISFAGVNYQKKYLLNLAKKNDTELICYLIPEVPVFPRHHIWKIDGRKLNDYQTEAYSVPFFNIPGIKQMTTTHSLRKIIRREIKKSSDTVFLTYNFDIEVAKAFKHENVMNKVYCILADLPIVEVHGGILESSFLRRRQNKSLQLLKKLENVVLINSNQLDYLSENVKHISIEGGITAESVCPPHKKETKEAEFCVLYSGAITAYSGINLLIDACKIASKLRKIRLIVFGNHEKMMEKCDSNFCIDYRGFVDNEEVVRTQNKADVLVNPRVINDPISLTTFPSKVLEYSVSSAQVLMTRIKGIPQEYYKYIDVCEDNPNAIACALEEIMNRSDDERIAKTQQRHKFLLSEKQWDKQIDRLIDFIGANSKAKV